MGLDLLKEDSSIHPSVDTAPSPVVALASDRSVAGRSATIYFLILLVTTTCLENHLQLSRRQQVCQVTIENKHTGTYWPCWVCSASQAQEKVFLVPLKWFLIQYHLEEDKELSFKVFLLKDLLRLLSRAADCFFWFGKH